MNSKLRVSRQPLADARFAKPLDEDLIRRLAKAHEVLITIEEGAIGGFSAQVLDFLARDGILDSGLKIRTMHLPDRFILQDAPYSQYDIAGLNAHHIVATVLSALGREGDHRRAQRQRLMMAPPAGKAGKAQMPFGCTSSRTRSCRKPVTGTSPYHVRVRLLRYQATR